MIARAAKLGGLALVSVCLGWRQRLRCGCGIRMRLPIEHHAQHAGLASGRSAGMRRSQHRSGVARSFGLPATVGGYSARLRGYVSGGECPGQTTPMLKTIAALPGDTVTVSTRGVSVNGQLLPTAKR